MSNDPERLTLYGSFTSSSSYKPMLFLALSGLPFSFRTVNLKNGAQHEDWYRAINPWGQVPALAHRGRVILQSNVVLDYLARATGHFEPDDEADRWRARAWLSWEADAIVNVARVRHFNRFRAVDPAVVAHFRPLAEAALETVDGALADRPWLVGDRCSIADLGCWGRMVFMDEGGFEIDRWPNLRRWADRIRSMPGYDHPYALIPKKDREVDPA